MFFSLWRICDFFFLLHILLRLKTRLFLLTGSVTELNFTKSACFPSAILPTVFSSSLMPLALQWSALRSHSSFRMLQTVCTDPQVCRTDRVQPFAITWQVLICAEMQRYTCSCLFRVQPLIQMDAFRQLLCSHGMICWACDWKTPTAT